jgi:hypothetical protein
VYCLTAYVTLIVSVEELVQWIATSRDILEVTGKLSLDTEPPAAVLEDAAKTATKSTVKRSSSKKN